MPSSISSSTTRTWSPASGSRCKAGRDPRRRAEIISPASSAPRARRADAPPLEVIAVDAATPVDVTPVDATPVDVTAA